MEDVEAQFDAFWSQWESRKHKKLIELRSSISTIAKDDIEKIERSNAISVADKKLELQVKVSEARQMQQDLWEGFQSWCKEVSALVEVVKRDGQTVSDNARRSAQILKRSRDEMEQRQQAELNAFHSRCVQVLNETAVAVGKVYEQKK